MNSPIPGEITRQSTPRKISFHQQKPNMSASLPAVLPGQKDISPLPSITDSEGSSSPLMTPNSDYSSTDLSVDSDDESSGKDNENPLFQFNGTKKIQSHFLYSSADSVDFLPVFVETEKLEK